MLHDARDQDILAVADGVDLDLASHQILIDQDRIFDLRAGDDAHVLADVRLGKGDLHALSAEDVGRTNQNRIAQTFCNLDRFLLREDGVARRTRDAGLVEDDVELLAILRRIDAPCRRTQNRNAE